MIRKPLPWSIKTICNMIEKQTLTFDNPIQRPGNQWKQEDKSLLIHSVLTMFVPDIYAIQSKKEVNGKMVNIYDIVDGKQRLNIFYDYLNNKWALTKLESVTLETTGETFDISDKTFSQLPEQVQNAIKEYNITARVIELEEGEDEENIIEDIFYRLNNGKAVSREHMALITSSHKVQKFVHRMATEHKLFIEVAKFSEGAIKKSDIQMTILQSILILSGLDFNSFAAKDIEQVFSENDIADQVLDLTEKSFNAIFEAFPEKHKFVTKINIPSMVYLFANSLNHADTTNRLLEYANSKALPADEYKRYTGAGNVKKVNVLGRMKGILSICKVEKRELVVKEETENQESDITPDNEELTNDCKEEAKSILSIVNHVA